MTRYPGIIVKAFREELDYPLRVVCRVKRAMRRVGVGEARIRKMRNRVMKTIEREAQENFSPSIKSLRKRIVKALRRWVTFKLRVVRVEAAKVVDSANGLHHWAARWVDPVSGEKRGQLFRASESDFLKGWDKGWRVEFKENKP